MKNVWDSWVLESKRAPLLSSVEKRPNRTPSIKRDRMISLLRKYARNRGLVFTHVGGPTWIFLDKQKHIVGKAATIREHWDFCKIGDIHDE